MSGWTQGRRTGAAHRGPQRALLRAQVVLQHTTHRAPSPTSALDLAKGETVAVVGESGSGKTTLGRATLHLAPISAGRIVFEGTDIADLDGRGADVVPAARPGHLPGPLLQPQPVHARGRAGRGAAGHPRARATATSASQACWRRWSRSSSRRQRSSPRSTRTRSPAASASASASPAPWCCEPDYLVADEPVSMIDASSRAEILYLLAELQDAARADLPVHHPRPRQRAPLRRPHRGHVRRAHRGAGAGGAADRGRQGTPTPRRCWRRCPSPIRPTGCGSARWSAASRPTRATCPRAVPSRRVVRWPSPAPASSVVPPLIAARRWPRGGLPPLSGGLGRRRLSRWRGLSGCGPPPQRLTRAPPAQPAGTGPPPPA